MKKVLAVMISFVLLSAMTACGNNNGSAGNNQVSVRPTETETEGEMGEETPEETESMAIDSEEETIPEEIESSLTVSEEETTPDETDAATVDSEEEPVSEENNSEQAEGSSILVAYFSRVGNMDFEEGVDVVTSASVNIEGDNISGNAQLLAQMAQEVTGGDLFFIETVEKYPAEYRGTTDQAKEEQDIDARPELASHVEDMDSYDTVILIYPDWWGTLPQPVFTFLEEYDFSGKTIWPLCTHEGSGLGSSESDIARLAPDAELAEGLAIRGSAAGSSQADVEAWLSDLKISE